MKHTKAVLYVSGVTNSTELLMNANQWGFEGATVTEALGIWKGIVETTHCLTIVGETEAPAHIVRDEDGTPYLNPPVPDAFEGRIRILAENLTRIYGQSTVLFVLTPVHAEFTTAQAGYVRNGG